MERTQVNRFALVDGEALTTVSIQNRGFNFGDGLFESMLVECGRIPLLSFHLNRLFQDSARLGISLDHDACHRALEKLGQWARENNIVQAKAKLIVTRAVGLASSASYPDKAATGQIIIDAVPINASNTENVSAPLELIPSLTPLVSYPTLVGIKHLSRLPYISAALGVDKKDNQEILFQDEDGNLVETMHHNILIEKNGALFTPKLDKVGVRGVMRTVVFNVLAPNIKKPIEEKNLSIRDLENADEVLLCNAVRGFIPVGKFLSSTFSRIETSQQLQSAFEQYRKSL